MSWEEFISFFNYPFVWYALIVGVLIALCSSLLGVTLVLKRFSFIGDSLSHVAFGAMAVAAVARLTNQMLIILPITILSAVFLLKSGRKAKVMGDASLAILSVSTLAIGYLIYNLSGSTNVSGDVCTTLFGSTSILALTQFDLWLSIAMSVAVIVFFILFYNKIFSITFDEAFAKATGVKTEVYNLLIAVIVAVVIVLSMNLVGSLLIPALIVFPSLSAMQVKKDFKGVVICSAILSSLCALLGILASIYFETVTGSTIVAVYLLAFIGFMIAGKIKRRS